MAFNKRTNVLRGTAERATEEEEPRDSEEYDLAALSGCRDCSGEEKGVAGPEIAGDGVEAIDDSQNEPRADVDVKDGKEDGQREGVSTLREVCFSKVKKGKLYV